MVIGYRLTAVFPHPLLGGAKRPFFLATPNIKSRDAAARERGSLDTPRPNCLIR
ncbi:MAG: hypothetical protein KDE56_06980 [Anaerolineales bacterium]|nr:hypothetical protein [Anaerolineales bacterium]